MKVIANFTLLIFILFSCTSKEEEVVAPTLQSNNRLQTLLDKRVHELVVPYLQANPCAGVSIGIIKKDSIFLYGYGYVSKMQRRIPDEHTVYEIGSVTKPFTAILLANAVNRRLVKLNDDVRQYLPSRIPHLSFDSKGITLTHLATHTSGLPRIPEDLMTGSVDRSNPFKNYDTTRLYRYLQDFKLKRQPGGQYEYSNLGMGVLGNALERIYKKSYESLVIEQICSQLNMTDTRIALNHEQHRRLLQGHTASAKPSACWEFGVMAPGGGLHSTVSDMLKFMQANMGAVTQPLKGAIESCQQVRYTAPQVAVGLGWHFGGINGKQLIWHDGRTAGYTSFFGFVKSTGTGVVVLSNSANHIDKISVELLKAINSQQ